MKASHAYVKLIEGKIGARFDIVACKTMQEVRLAWESGHVDLVGSLQDRPERREYLRFSKPYYSVGNVILMRRAASKHASSMAELKHSSIGIVEGSATHDYVRENFPQLNIVDVKTVADGFVQLSARKVDAFVTDKGVASFYIEQRGYPDILITGSVAYTWDLRFATSKDHPELKSIIGKALRSITPLQRFKIHSRWMARAEKEKLLVTGATVSLVITLLARSSLTRL